MSIATLQDIITKVRKLTASSNSLQITDSDIIDYINSFYLYDFPAQFRSLDLQDTYTFNTIRGIDTYPFDFNQYTTVQGPVYVAKRETRLFFDPGSFYAYNFSSNSHWQFQQTLITSSSGTITNITQANPAVVTSVGHGLSTGNLVTISDVLGMVEINGLTSAITVIDDDTFSLNTIDSTAFTAYTSGGTWVTNAFLGTLQSTPILRSINNNPMAQTLTANPNGDVFPTGYPPNFNQAANISRVQNLLITVNISNGTTLNVTDDGAEGLIGDIGTGANTIDYSTGEINVAFSQTIPAGTEIRVLYNPVVMSIPLSILFWQKQFTLRPVPDRGYTVELVAYRLPSQALLGTTSTTTPTLTGIPEINEWWETLAFGAAKKVYEDRLDMEGVGIMDKALQERYSLNYTRTYANLGKRKINTIFSDQIDYTWGNNSIGFGNSGSV